MVALIVGIILVAFCVIACIPALGFCWAAEVINFLKGFAPVFAAFAGLVSILIGLADIKDKKEAKREEKALKETK